LKVTGWKVGRLKVGRFKVGGLKVRIAPRSVHDELFKAVLNLEP
jgi:hypothetical protein